MNAAGFTETIWHFIGYLHLVEEMASRKPIYNGDPLPAAPDDPGFPLREMSVRIDMDEPFSAGRMQIDLRPNYHEPGPYHQLPAPPATPKMATPLKDIAAMPPPSPPAMDIQLQFIPPTRSITVEYRDGGTETLLSIHQVNMMDDRDIMLDDALRDQNGNTFIPTELQFKAMLEAMIHQAEQASPDALPTRAGGSTEEIINAVTARDALWAATGQAYSGDALPSAPTGRIVDGVRSDAPLAEPDMQMIAPWRASTQDDTSEAFGVIDKIGPSKGIATIAEAGLNTQINVAGIFDVNEASGSLIVGGDYFFSRGIVQVNVLTDNDHVQLLLSRDPLQSVFTKDNQVHNIAEFISHDYPTVYGGAAVTPNWTVDVFHGNFYDIKSIVQFNNMIDNDRITQTTSGTYLEVATGGNTQINLTEIIGLGDYDLIVIKGDYHRADWIFQYNVVLDSDIAKFYSSGGSGTDVTTGFNRLANEAQIVNHDGAEFSPMNSSHHDLMAALDSGTTILTPNADWQLSGSASGTLKVLYVTGDYYDVNVITQMNLLTDMDQVIQANAMAGASQGAALGGNQAYNYAQIIDGGTLSSSKYLGGMAYEESVLVQANIISDSDTVLIGDTHTLIPEFVAFAHDADLDSTTEIGASTRPLDVGQIDHMMGGIMT